MRAQRSLAHIVASWFLVALSDPDHGQAQTAVPALRVGTLSGPLVVDGRLDEADWAAADAVDGLTMVEPTEGVPSSMLTRMRVLANASTLVFGVECMDSDPDAVVSFTTARDGDLLAEDSLRIVLGPFLDGRSGYVFAVNPSGARWDAIIKPGGEDENAEWDGIWEAVTRRHAAGWTVEIRLPVSTIGFARGATTWHLNVQRRIERLQEVARWASPSRNFQPSQTSRAGLLTGLPEFDLGVGLTLRPALVGGGGIETAGAPLVGELDPSLDATQRLGSNLLASLTINTDFAETEVDTRRTNLTRFPLFFPEKRTFFLAGSDIFEFGLGLGEDVIPFFSRRVGLVDGEEVPIAIGGKLTGRVSNTNLAGEFVRTREASLPTRDVEAAGMGVVRVTQNLGRESRAGLIATVGDPVGRSGSWTLGGDATYQTTTFRGDRNLVAGVWALTMDRDGLGADRHAWGFKIDYPNDRWDARLVAKDIGADFDPSLGFVPRQGIRRYDTGVTFAPRPGHGVRRLTFEVQPTLVTDRRNRWESYEVFLVPIGAQLESGDSIDTSLIPVGERLLAPFEIAEGVVIAPGMYEWRRYELDVETAAKRRMGAEVEYSTGGFYDGTLEQISLELRWTPTSLLTFEATTERAVGRLPSGRFSQTLANTRVRVNASPDLSISSVVQYDSVSDSLGTNTRLRWTFDPRGDLFVIYNHKLRDRLDRWDFESNQLLVKLQYAVPF